MFRGSRFGCKIKKEIANGSLFLNGDLIIIFIFVLLELHAKRGTFIDFLDYQCNKNKNNNNNIIMSLPSCYNLLIALYPIILLLSSSIQYPPWLQLIIIRIIIIIIKNSGIILKNKIGRSMVLLYSLLFSML